MKNKRSIAAAVSAFCLTVCVLGTVGGMILTDMRSGRTLFGEAYEQVAIQREDTAVTERNSVFDLMWLPARWQLLCRVPLWETQVIQWLLSRG
ncbi:MAG: hypothetical protein IJP14_00435 [Clostridia bacterium]|nr:hypothetical protein [Clostridia bacterium]